MKIPAIVWIILAAAGGWYIYQQSKLTAAQAALTAEQTTAAQNAALQQYLAQGNAQAYNDLGTSLTVPLANAGASIIGNLGNLFTGQINSAMSNN